MSAALNALCAVSDLLGVVLLGGDWGTNEDETGVCFPSAPPSYTTTSPVLCGKHCSACNDDPPATLPAEDEDDLDSGSPTGVTYASLLLAAASTAAKRAAASATSPRSRDCSGDVDAPPAVPCSCPPAAPANANVSVECFGDRSGVTDSYFSASAVCTIGRRCFVVTRV